MHRKLYPHHLQILIKHVQEGKDLDCYGDVPEGFGERISEEEQRRRADQKYNKAAATPVGMTPITINNILPEQAPNITSSNSHTKQDHSIKSPPLWLMGTPLDVPGCLDAAVRNDCVK